MPDEPVEGLPGRLVVPIGRRPGPVDPVPDGRTPPSFDAFDAVLKRDYAAQLAHSLGPMKLPMPEHPPVKRTMWRRAKRIGSEIDARIRMAWQILVHGEHQY